MGNYIGLFVANQMLNNNELNARSSMQFSQFSIFQSATLPIYYHYYHIHSTYICSSYFCLQNSIRFKSKSVVVLELYTYTDQVVFDSRRFWNSNPWENNVSNEWMNCIKWFLQTFKSCTPFPFLSLGNL